MRTFYCEHCQAPVYFENTHCTGCGHALGLLPEYLRISAMQPLDDVLWRAMMPAADGRTYRQCENYHVHHVCNWMVPAESDERFCIACQLNDTIPNLSRPGFTEQWYRIERSKRRLVYSLLKLGLPVRSKELDPTSGLAFSFKSQVDAEPDEQVMTGHANGHITINLDEADPAQRERNRLDLQERYRTLLGHFRHEIGHYYWDLLIAGSAHLESFRALFGDEREDYGEALERHYKQGPVKDWQAQYISAYASMHPWEDWAETWAHYLHIVDTLETAENFGISMEHRRADGSVSRAAPDFNPYAIVDFEPLIEHWTPLTFALNSLNRSMGLQDLYPFVLSRPAIEKLAFVHHVIGAQRVPEHDGYELTGEPGSRVQRSGLMARLRRLFG